MKYIKTFNESIIFLGAMDNKLDKQISNISAFFNVHPIDEQKCKINFLEFLNKNFKYND